MPDRESIRDHIERAGIAGTEPPGIRTSVSEGIAVVVINHPAARNALGLGMWAGIRDTFIELARRDEVRAVVVRGAGDAAFAAGANIAEFPENRLTAAQAATYNTVLGDALRAVAECPVPVLAAIRGFAVGGGCEIAAACDLRIGADDARIGIPIGRLGVVLGMIETRLLVRHIGVNGLKRVLFTGELFDANASLQLGLLDELVAIDELWDRVADITTRIATSSSATIRAAKAVTDLAGSLEPDVSDRIHRLFLDAYDGPELREGVTAFLEKRQPDFDGVRA